MEDIGTSIASKILEEPVALIGRQLSYLICYDCNIQSLKDALKRLDDKKIDVQRSVEAAKRNGEIIKVQVESWLEDVDKIFSEVQELENEVNLQRRCLYGLCPSLKSRYSLSRKAKKIAQRVLDLKLDEGLSNNVANPAPLQQPGLIISSEGFKGFESRKDVMNDVLSALRNEKTRIIGICGMGGVGKTTMVREIIKRLEGTSLFDNVVMVTVSATVNIRTIQTDIADSLGMKFVEESESRRALRLHERIKQSNRILIILDDVWSEVKLQDVGIPFGVHEGCKILLTSRDEGICKVMGCKDDIFRVQALNKEEAWELFRATVGESLDNNPDLSHVAKLIVDECKGLPIAIITVGKALLPSNGKHEWLTALQELKNSVPENIPGMEHSVYSCIKLSYDKLESDEVKSCFLLCCLFPEDYDVPIEYLVRYGLGRATFRNTNTVEEVRNKVHSFVGQLKRRYLLLDSLKEECIKMHDIVRDVAISIALKDPHRFMVRSFDAEGGGGGRPGLDFPNQEHCSAISLTDVKLDENITDGLDCPKLELLQLKNSSSSSEYSNHFKGLKELKVLAFLGMDMSSYLASKRSLALGEPKYLHTLCLEDCKLGDISHVIGGLVNLEILSFARSQINKLPREIGLLHRLRMLDATDCEGLEEIPHGVLSNLWRLEELYMAESFLNWGLATGSKDETSMASLDEVMSLFDHLNVLAIKIPDAQMLRNVEFLLKSQPIRFHVSINISWFIKNRMRGYMFKNSYKNRMRSYLFENSLMLRGDVKEYLEIGAVRYLLKRSEDLSLNHTSNLKYVIEELDDKGGFEQLKVLSIMYDKNIEYLMNGTDWTRRGQPAFPILKSVTFENVYKLKVVCRGKLPGKHSFVNLRSIAINSCEELKYVFSLSIAQNLVQLQSLKVENCYKVEEIISKERMEDDNASERITFPRLTILNLSALRKLRGFYTGNQRDFTYEIIKPNDKSANKMKETRNDNQVAGSTSSKSKLAQVRSSCNALFPSNCISWLPNLEQLELKVLTSEQGLEENSESEELVVKVFDLEGHLSAFSQLQILDAWSLDEVEHLWKNVQPGFQGFQNVRSLTIISCKSLKYLCPYEIYKLLVNLQQVTISHCENMETIVLAAASTEDNIHEEGKETGGSGAMTLFPKLLNRFRLFDLPSLEKICPGAHSFAWSSSTRTMDVMNCPKLKTLGFVPISKKLSAAVAGNLNDDHVRGREESGSGCASSTEFGCAPLVCLQSRPSSRNFTQILPRPVKREVMPANLQISSATHNLEHLLVLRCDLLEVIFLVQETPSTQAFDKLRELKLVRLPMLSHIWEKGLQVSSGFGNLILLQVGVCGNLRYLFSLHIAKLLTYLETIEVSNCSAMEKIVGEAEGGESIEDELTFPHMNSIILRNLPKLESFCSQAYTLKWPAWTKVEVENCPKCVYEASTWREKKNIIRSQEAWDKTT